MLEKPPDAIWLQYHGDADPDDGPVDMSDITWCNEQIFDSDIQYIRADVARRADRKAREECAEICDARAMECERKVKPDSADETANLRSLAWQFSVLAQQIRATIKGE